MKQVEKKTGVADKKASTPSGRAVPLVVPHGGAEAGRDFESAFDLLEREGQVHELWRGKPAKQRIARAS
ncbi:MAG: hypothetical protein ACREQB_01865 [Candidatus Binataceae bacterium]